MAWAPTSLITPQFQNANNNEPASGYVLKAYLAGTTTNTPMATDSTGGTTFTDVSLNSAGYPEHLGQTIIPHIDRSYKLALYATQAAADADTGAVWTIDSLEPIDTDGNFTIDDATSSGVTNVISATHTTSGTPTAGIGVGIALNVETTDDNTETGGIVEVVATDVSAGAEDFDRVTKLMEGGAAAAERDRLTSAGVYTTTGSIQLNKGADVASATSLPVLTDGNYFDVTGTTTITSIATTKVGNHIHLQFDGALTLTHHATDLILPGGANITTAAGDIAEFVEYASGDYVCVNYTRASGRPVLLDALETDLSANGNQIQWSKGADVASATALPVLTDGNYFDVTGTTTVTSIDSTAVGNVIKLHFDAALTLTHNATSLVLPGGANITTAAGDEAEFIEYSSGNYRCTSYTAASGAPLVQGTVGDHEVVVTAGNGHGSTNTTIRRFTTTQSSAGTDITYADSSTNGASFTINRAGLYAITYIDGQSANAGIEHGISVNSSQLTTAISGITAADRLGITGNSAAGSLGSITVIASLALNDVIRPHTDGTQNLTAAGDTIFRIRRIGTV
jgi:hypothetical protein